MLCMRSIGDLCARGSGSDTSEFKHSENACSFSATQEDPMATSIGQHSSMMGKDIKGFFLVVPGLKQNKKKTLEKEHACFS